MMPRRTLSHNISSSSPLDILKNCFLPLQPDDPKHSIIPHLARTNPSFSRPPKQLYLLHNKRNVTAHIGFPKQASPKSSETGHSKKRWFTFSVPPLDITHHWGDRRAQKVTTRDAYPKGAKSEILSTCEGMIEVKCLIYCNHKKIKET